MCYRFGTLLTCRLGGRGAGFFLREAMEVVEPKLPVAGRSLRGRGLVSGLASLLPIFLKLNDRLSMAKLFIWGKITK